MPHNDPDLMCLYWTNAGIAPGEGEISPYDFQRRVEAAASAGFTGIGLWHTDLEHCTVHRSLKEMKSILDDNGIRRLELEFLTDWFVSGARKEESDGRRKRLLEASAVLGASHVKVGDFYNTPCTIPQVAEAFAALCKEAEKFGARIGFEFMPSSMIDNLADSLKMVEMSGVKNGGIILDIVHVMNLQIPFEEVSRIPVEHLVNVELNDGARPGSPLHDPARARRFCGEGDYDIAGFVAAVRQSGYTGPWAVEVFSRELAELPLEELTQKAHKTTLPYLV